MDANRSWIWLVGSASMLVACGSDAESGPLASQDKLSPPDDSTEIAAPSGSEAQTPTVAAPSGSSVTSDYTVEKAWAEAHGVTIEAGRPTVIAKRRGTDKRTSKYEDELVVLRSNETVVRFVGTTKPAQMPSPSGTLVPDVDGDGRKDLGIVRPGIYKARGGVKYGLSGYERPAFKVFTEADDGGLPAWRDLTGDGIYSDAEKATAESKDYRITGVYIHYGFAMAGTKLGKDTFVGPWSVGCQNVQYDELDTFIEAVGGPDAVFRYAIVDDR